MQRKSVVDKWLCSIFAAENFFYMNKEELIEIGEKIISSSYQKDVFNIGSIEDVVDDDVAKLAIDWFEDVRLFVAKMDNKIIYDQVMENVPIIGNNNRISKERIGRVINVLINM